MTRIVTLGDSITLGLGDPRPDGGWRGWARLLADGLVKPELHNLAANGAQAKHVERDQLPTALVPAPLGRPDPVPAVHGRARGADGAPGVAGRAGTRLADAAARGNAGRGAGHGVSRDDRCRASRTSGVSDRSFEIIIFFTKGH
jgi:hypothetical protein